MYFINRIKNTVNLHDIDKIILYLENEAPQELNTEDVKRSKVFHSMVLNGSFLITSYDATCRIETNLYRIQNGLVPQSPTSRPRVVFRGHFDGHMGFSKANRNLACGLLKAGIDLTLDPISPIVNLSIGESTFFNRLVQIPQPDSILLHSCIPSFASPNDAKYSILYTTVEASSVPDQFVENTKWYDEVWITSLAGKEILIKAGCDKPINVVPNSVNTNHYKPGQEKLPFKPLLRDFVFVCVASWNVRKGWEPLLRAYIEEFNEQDNVSLLMVTPYNYDKEFNRKYTVENTIKRLQKPNGPNIARCGTPIEEELMPSLYNSAHAFVLPTLGEGFGLPLAEASACGLPVISTNCSGQSMFLNHDNAFLLDVDRYTRDIKTGVHYWDNQLFPDINDNNTISKLGKLMRYVYTHQSLAIEKNKILQQNIRDNYSIEAVGKLAASKLENICNQM